MMILADTSIWIDHLREGNEELAVLLRRSQVLSHAFVIGELACGNLRNRDQVLRLLANLPQATAATDPEVLYFIEQHGLMGRGIGYVDAHLLAATALGHSAQIWTRDKRMNALAVELGLAYVAKNRP